VTQLDLTHTKALDAWAELRQWEKSRWTPSLQKRVDKRFDKLERGLTSWRRSSYDKLERGSTSWRHASTTLSAVRQAGARFDDVMEGGFDQLSSI
jgi:ribosomal protein L32E